MQTKKTRLLSAATTLAALAIGGGVLTGTASAAPQKTPCATTAKACVDLASKQVWLQDNTGISNYGPVPMSGGKAGSETPKGTFKVQWKDADHFSQEFQAPMPNAVFFTNTGIAFHEGSLEQESNGCVHLSTTAAKKVFDNLNQNDEVQVVG